MSRITVRGLTPGVYGFQVRSRNGQSVSAWSPKVTFTIAGDTLAPAQPTGLTWVVSGTSFAASWNAVTTNSDGSTLEDFWHYQVKVYNVDSPAQYQIYTQTSLTFNFSFEMNRQVFGSPKPNLGIEVSAIDTSKNVGNPATATASNPAPGAVTGLTATGYQDTIAVSFTPPADTDLDHYEIWFSPTSGSGGTKVYVGQETSPIIPTTTYTLQYVRVYAVDIFGTSSAYTEASATARNGSAVDTTPPADPTAVSVSTSVDPTDASGGTSYIDISWTGVSDTDLQDYIVKWATNVAGPWQFEKVPGGTTTARIDNLAPATGYYVAVAAEDFSGNVSNYVDDSAHYPITTAADTTGPAQVTGVLVFGGLTTVTVLWTGNTDMDVIYGRGYYEIQIDTVNTFDSANLKQAQTGGTVTSFSNLTTGTTYYVRVRARDASGNAGTWSTTSSVTPRYFSTSDAQSGTISGDIIAAATLAGDRIIANSVDANVLKANTTISQNLYVGSVFTMATAGVMQSDNYSAGVAGWKFSHNTLEINDGSIAAAALSLQQGHNLVPLGYGDFEFSQNYYTSANLGFSNMTVSIDASTVKFNSQSLKLVDTSGATNYITLAAGTAYNILVDAQVSYIVSGYFYQSSGSAQNVVLRVQWSDGTTTDTTVSVPTGAWTRISGVVTVPAGISKARLVIGVPASQTIYVDGLQVERKWTSSTIPSQWKPPSSTTIDGGAIRTGSIQSNATVTIGSLTLPSWSINTQGNLQVNDAVVRGHLVLGSGSDIAGDLANMYVRSYNYATGSAGWQIKGDGSGEFNNVTVRGTVYASAGSFTGSITASSGTIGGWTIGASSLSGSGTISGGTITGSNIYGVQVSTRSDGTTGNGATLYNSGNKARLGLFTGNASESGGGDVVATDNTTYGVLSLQSPNFGNGYAHIDLYSNTTSGGASSVNLTGGSINMYGTTNFNGSLNASGQSLSIASISASSSVSAASLSSSSTITASSTLTAYGITCYGTLNASGYTFYNYNYNGNGNNISVTVPTGMTFFAAYEIGLAVGNSGTIEFQARPSAGDTSSYYGFAGVIRNTSSQAFKENITDAGIVAKDIINKTRVVKYTHKMDSKTRKAIGPIADKPVYGFLVEELPDELQHGDGYYVGALLGVLWKAVQELSSELADLKKGKP